MYYEVQAKIAIHKVTIICKCMICTFVNYFYKLAHFELVVVHVHCQRVTSSRRELH